MAIRLQYPVPAPASFEQTLENIRQRAGKYDQSGDFPVLDLLELAHFGAMKWAIPASLGGEDLGALDLHLRYERIASASLATALVLTQRDSAIGLIDGSPPWARRVRMLNKLRDNEWFSTVGIAQLTTSRQGAAPALRARAVDGGFELNGEIPWSTGAALADFLIAGAALDDGSRILFAMPRHLSSTTINEPPPMVALNSTWTTSVRLEKAWLESMWVMRGPARDVLGGKSKGLVLGQAFLALGLCRGGLDLIAEHDSDRAREAHAQLSSQLAPLRQQIIELSQPGREEDARSAAPNVRGICNDLALRITHAAVTLYKGSALFSSHPAQRMAREALFLLVWSCPDPVIDCTLDLLARR